jgi:hypothetical protein
MTAILINSNSRANVPNLCNGLFREWISRLAHDDFPFAAKYRDDAAKYNDSAVPHQVQKAHTFSCSNGFGSNREYGTRVASLDV